MIADPSTLQRLTLAGMPDRPLTVAEVAQVMSIGREVTPQAVYKWIRTGVKIRRGKPDRAKLKAMRLPTGYCVMPEAINDFLAELNGDTTARYKGMTEAEILEDVRARRGHTAHVPG